MVNGIQGSYYRMKSSNAEPKPRIHKGTQLGDIFYPASLADVKFQNGVATLDGKPFSGKLNVPYDVFNRNGEKINGNEAEVRKMQDWARQQGKAELAKDVSLDIKDGKVKTAVIHGHNKYFPNDTVKSYQNYQVGGKQVKIVDIHQLTRCGGQHVGQTKTTKLPNGSTIVERYKANDKGYMEKVEEMVISSDGVVEKKPTKS